MTRRERRQYWLLVVLWAFVNGQFWTWWLGGNHLANPALFVVASVALGYSVTFLASIYLFFVGQMRLPVPIPVGRAEKAGVIRRVAVISLTVPGAESPEIVRRQLLAMHNIRYPHDSWILVDKEHSPEIAALADSLGVKYFSRHEVERWGADKVEAWSLPATKAGNVNTWLSTYGSRYSHFVQLDIDHIPDPGYLDTVLGYFADPKVKWVQAPSVYGNFESWAARGSSEQELVLQGPLQMGYFGYSRTPFIIGSHTTYDTAAIVSIGGFQPTRAEDHLDTVCLAAEGHEGVFVPKVIAVGDGPENFETYLAQQFAWSYSMIQVLLFHTPRLIPRYRKRQVAQFLFAQSWYANWSTATLVLFGLPLVSLAFDAPIAHVGYFSFLAYSLPVAAVGTVIWFWTGRWMFPKGLRLSWRGVALHVARWMFVVGAFFEVIFRVKKPYMITRKGVDADAPRAFPMRLAIPYAGLAVAALTACWLYLGLYQRGPTQGYLIFGLQGALLVWLLLVIVLTQEVRDKRRYDLSLASRLRLHARPLLLTAALGVALVVTTVVSAQPIYDALRSRF